MKIRHFQGLVKYFKMNQKDIAAERNGEQQHNFGDGYSKTQYDQDTLSREQKGQKRGIERAGTIGNMPSRGTLNRNQGPGDSRKSVPTDQAPATLKSPKMSGAYSNQNQTSNKGGSRIGQGSANIPAQYYREPNNYSSNFSSSSQNSKNSSSKNYNSNTGSNARVGSLTTRNKNMNMQAQAIQPQVLHQNSGSRIGAGAGAHALKNQTSRDQINYPGSSNALSEAERGSSSQVYQQIAQNSMMASQVTQLRVQQNEPASASNVLQGQNSLASQNSGNSRIFKNSNQGQTGAYGATSGVAGTSRFSNQSSGKASNFSAVQAANGIQRVRLSPKNRKPGVQDIYRPTNYAAMNQTLDHKALPQGQSFGQNARGTMPNSNFSNMDIEGQEENKEQEALLRAMNRDQQKMISALQSQQTGISVIDLLAIMSSRDEYLRKTVNNREQNFPDGFSIDLLAKDILTTSVNDESILQTPLNLHNQRTIKVDSERTRVYDIKSVLSQKSENDPDHEKTPVDAQDSALNQQIVQEIEKVLTFYTKRSGTTYKQGYNELLGPFLWLAHLNRKKVPTGQGGDSRMANKNGNFDKGIESQLLSNPLTLGLQSLNFFVKNFLPTLFLDDDFVCLQSCFCLLRLLLKYHDPEISIVLSAAGVTPELYATSWFFTYFANKCERLEVICELWSRIIQDQRINNKYIFALSIALIIYNRNMILYSEKSDLPGTMTRLTFESMEQLDEVMNIANQVFENTPVSFWESDEMNALFGENSHQYYRGMTRDQKMQMHLKLESMQCLPISVSEFFRNVYPEHVTCGNPRCFKYYQIDSLLRTNSTSPGLSQNNLNDTTKFSIEGYAIKQGQIRDFEEEDGILIANDFEAPIDIDLGMDSDREGSPQKGQDRTPDRNGQQTQGRGGPSTAAYAEPGGMLGTKSPFKTLVKQQPIEADASVVPMETETNVRDDEADQSPLQKQTNNFGALQHEYGGQSMNQNHPTATARAKEYRQTLVRKLESEGVDVTNITPLTRFPDGPAYAELCEDCRINRLSTDSQRRSHTRLLVLDCRSSMLHKETMLPRCGKIDIGNTCDRRSLVEQVRGFIEGCKDQAHICLMGLNQLEVPKDYTDAQEQYGLLGQSPLSHGKNGGQEQDHALNIKEFHDKVLRSLIEIFYKENFKFISFLPGGFETCHDFIEKQNYQIEIKRQEKTQGGSSQGSQADLSYSNQMPFMQFLHPHNPNNCFHCTFKDVLQSESSMNFGASGSTYSDSSMAQARQTQSHQVPLSMRSKQKNAQYSQSDSSSIQDIGQDHRGNMPLQRDFSGAHESNRTSFRQSQRQYSGNTTALAQRWNKYESARFLLLQEDGGLGDQYGNGMQYQDQMNRGQQQENQSDLFTGFRHWWQDNVTNNQRLRGFVVPEQDQQNMTGNQSIINRGMGRSPFNNQITEFKENFQDSNEINPLLQNVTQQTRAQIQNSKQRDQNFKTPQDNSNGPAGNFFQSEFSRPQIEYENNPQNTYNAKASQRFGSNQLERDKNQSLTQPTQAYNQTGGNQFGKNTQQFNGKTMQPQNRMRLGNSSMGNVLNPNQMSPNKKGANNDKYSASEEMKLNIHNYQNQNQTYSSSLQQSPTVRPSKFTESNQQTQGMTLAHKSLLRPKAGPVGRERSTDGQPKPLGMQRHGMNSANRQSGSNIHSGINSGHLMSKGIQNNLMVSRPVGQQSLTSNKLNARPGRDNSERAVIGGMRHDMIQEKTPGYNKYGNFKNNLQNQHIISQGGSARSEGEENDTAFDLGSGDGNQKTQENKEQQKNSLQQNNGQNKKSDKFWSNEDPSNQIPQQQKVRADLSKPNEKTNSCAESLQPSGTSQSSMAPQQFQLEERSYYLCNGIQKQQSYFFCQQKVQKIVQNDAPANSNDIVIYHVKRLASSHLQQAIQQQQMSQNQDGTPKKSQIFGHDKQNPNITSIIITQFTTICLCQSYSIIQSRFFMHDLIKITSRKSSAKIITFYFRIPQFGEYNQNYYNALELGQMNENSAPQSKDENIILESYNENPKIYYQFAYKRKKYQEVKMGFEFPTEDEARDCIERVSVLYKRLKNSYKN